MNLGPDHYRFEDVIDNGGVRIVCRRYVVCGETPACYYVIDEDMRGYIGQTGWEATVVKQYRRRVLKSSWKRFCYPDMRQALESYRAGKKGQLSHAKLALSRAEAALGELEGLLAFENLAPETFPHQCEGGGYIKGLRWIEY